jgi:DNA topoisomerase-2
MKKIEEKYKVLDHVSHVLLRPGTYVGSNKPHTGPKWIFDSETQKMVKTEITFIPSFLKIFDEIVTNSFDEHKRTPSLNKIEINVNKDSGEISVKDNGGIPVILHKEHNQYVPEVIFGNLMAGSSYDDSEERIVAGTNGLGAKLTIIFSKKFELSTCDGKNHFYQEYSNNMRDRTKPTIKRSTKNHTEIKYTPDFEKFGMQGLDDDHYRMIQKRVIDLSGCNPNCKVFFNGEPINVKSFEDYIKFYKEEFFFESNKDKTWFIGVGTSDDGFQQISFANSTDTYDGGTHVDYILNQILSQLREFFQKKHKVDVKPSELKNHITLFINATVVNPSFSSQTKEKLITEVKDFGFTYEVGEKIIKQILKSEIVESVLDWIQQKKSADESKLARELNKSLSKVKVDKLIDAKSKDRWKCSLSIFEGDSASSAFRKYRDSQYQGAFSLRGKFVNVADIPTNKLLSKRSNGDYVYKEVVDLMGALGLKLGQKVVPGTLRYGRILFYCDADHDGSSIVGLLINFLYKFWPELFENPMVFKADTPIVVSTNLKKKSHKISFYTQYEYNQWLNKINTKDWEIEYKKGLAALVDDEYREIINNPRLTQITTDEQSKESLNTWFGEESDLRKSQLMK